MADALAGFRRLFLGRVVVRAPDVGAVLGRQGQDQGRIRERHTVPIVTPAHLPERPAHQAAARAAGKASLGWPPQKPNRRARERDEERIQGRVKSVWPKGKKPGTAEG